MHTLMGGGGLHEGFDALDYGKLGNYHILSVLPDKFARFLYEFHDFLLKSIDLPPLPADRSNSDVMEPSILIRFGSCCISAPVCNMPVIVIIMIV